MIYYVLSGNAFGFLRFIKHIIFRRLHYTLTHTKRLEYINVVV